MNLYRNFRKKIILGGVFPLIPLFRNSKGYAVLMYHRIVKDKMWYSDLIPTLSVKLNDFEKQISFFNKRYKIIPLSDMVNRINNNRKPDSFYLSISFDDGYADNYLLGGPILKKYNIKPTIFITTNFIENNEIPFWDILKIFAEINHDVFTFNDLQGKKIKFELKTIFDKRKFIDAVSRLLKNDPDYGKYLLQLIKKKIPNNNMKDIQFFSWDLLYKIVHQEDYEIGCHTKSHPLLGLLKDNGKEEIKNSKTILENKLNIPITNFAYPFGSGENVITSEVLLNIKNSEFRGAFTGEIGINSEKDNNFLLKRIGVLGGEKLWELKSKILLANIVKYIYKKSNKSYY